MQTITTARAAAYTAMALLVVAAIVGLAGGAADSPPGDLVAVERTSTASVVAFAQPDVGVGSSTLVREADAMRMQLDTDALSPRETVTAWWVVFNEPDACAGPCDGDDIFVGGDPAAPLDQAAIARADVVAAYATGQMASADGAVDLRAEILEGEREGTREVILGDGATLKDAATAEVHLVVRSHGPAIEGQVDDQIGSFGGGCTSLLVPPDAPDAPGECGDVLFAVHLP